MKRITSYLRSRIPFVLLVLLFGLVFLLVFDLYGLHAYAQAASYAAMLCLFFLLIFACFDFGRWRNRCKTVEELKNSTSLRVDELPAPRDLLESRYQELVRLLAQECIGAQAQAEEQRRQTADYYALWTHQIKTPVAAMYLMLRGEDENTRAQRAQLFRIEQYVQMALTYVHTDAASTDFVFRKCSLMDAARACVRKYAPLFIRAHVRVQITGEDASVLSDEKGLCFMIEQALSNAIKYTNEGGCVTLAISKDEIEICDTGVGIAKEDLPRVFDNGFTGRNGRLDKRATGVGLYLLSRTAKLLSCRVALSSELGKGTCVKLSFPPMQMLAD